MKKNSAMLDLAITSLFVTVMLHAIPSGNREVPVQNDAVSAAAAVQGDEPSTEEIVAEFSAMY